MYNDLFSIGGFTIHGYGLMIGIGIAAAYLTAEYRAKKAGLEPDHLFYLLILGAGGGLICAKLLYYVTIFDEIRSNPRLLLNISTGFVVYGGIIGGIGAGFVYCHIRKISPLRYLDLVVPSIALAQGFGRIGCLLAGCCYGRQTPGPFSITFQSSQFAPNGIPLLPTQIVSSVFDFANFLVLLALARKNPPAGRVSAFYLIFYSLGRFVIEFYRGDLIRGSVGNLSTSQFISLFVALAGFILLWKSGRNKNQLS
ncbi:prolipoprotein diacylglyceryl transferase [Lacrimispora defluvii]|uniref:Phosphatidylglycerol--prolipoprotein diacylglyceryl transferase n=1 Tax=Lacrimispora defluvii TaxID=2719233 RepID=A0ABX1VR75_9FIRM|nr:prolipoprotein diacylglyceryl transferase [Lacrimispora defluvii]NNJ29402.1 prolipoprotein diacylglyceryl transferase [Lacrimispora defluvii]